MDGALKVPRRGSLAAFVLASRPATLTAAVVPVSVGTGVALAVGGFRAGPALAALLGAILIQIGTNFANDVFDYEKGADTEHRLGPTRAVAAGLLSPTQVRAAMIVAFLLAAVAGLYLFAVAGWAIVAIGVASILSGLAYTGGPYPLGYHGLGDVFVMIFFGFVAVCGTVYVQVGAVPVLGWWAAVPPGALATAILVVNNLRDRRTDAQANKRTLAVRLGRRGALIEYGVLVGGAYAVPVLLAATGSASPWVLLPLVSAPLAWRRLGELRRGEGTALNAVLGSTAKLLLVHGLLFSLGLALSAP